MKLTIKLFLVLVIATSTVLAEGDMTNGGFNADGDMSNGGRTCITNCPTLTPTNVQTANETDTQMSDEGDDSILTIIENYFGSLLG
jgi:hypothetical protein